jgi:hypothetical protein
MRPLSAQIRSLIRLAGLAVFIISAGPGPVGAQAGHGDRDTRECRPLTGSFLQPLAHHAGWSQADWDVLMEDLAAVGVRNLYLQWTKLDDFTVFGEDSGDAVESALLDRVLRASAAHRVNVWLGLLYSPAYWERVQRGPDQLAVYLQRHRVAVRELAGELQDRVGGHPAVAGWYVTEEVDDVNWWARDKRQLFRDHLRMLTAELRAIAPGRPVAISGFTSVTLDPSAYAELWRGLVAASRVDLVLFQDGGGVGSLQPAESDLYLRALAPAVRSAGARFGVIVELFTQHAGPPLDDAPFAAGPGELDRIREQIAVAADDADRLVGFSFPEYMSAGGGPAAARLYREYRSWQEACAEPEKRPGSD